VSLNNSSIPVTAVFDIGKTNKKFLLFDENYEIAFQQYSTMEEARDFDDDGYACENLKHLVSWVKRKLKAVIQNDTFDVRALNFSTYGASLVHLGDTGNVVTPFYNYMKPYPENLLRQFYEKYGGKEQFALETASPPMGMLNSGLQLYWLKYAKPSLYKRIEHTLHFPQYLSSTFTGEFTTEFTSIGCHTGMWNYNENRYHRWLEKEGMLHLFPSIQSVTETRRVKFAGTHFEAGPGMHDSSAALSPYLLAMDEPFLLLSTGTWSVTLNPFNDAPLTFEELRRDCLCFLNMYGEQVKAARLFLGNEYSHQKKKLEKYFGRDDNDDEVTIDKSILQKILISDNTKRKLRLETAYSSGPFPGEKPEEWNPEVFSSYEEAYHQLMLDLVTIQSASIKLAEGAEPLDRIIVTGGFSRNKLFLKLLASRFPEKKICTASLSHVSALGTAVAIDNSDVKSKLKRLLGLEYHAPVKGMDIRDYQWKKPSPQKQW